MTGTTQREARETLEPGDIIGRRYRVIGKLGEGGMGQVYDAVHLTLERPVALKVIPQQLADDEALLERFFREARAAAQIGHPGIVEVFDLGTEPAERVLPTGREVVGTIAYLAMEKLEGEELADRLERLGRLRLREALSITADVAEAVAAAHARGIVHRDLKPQNVFLLDRGSRQVAKVLDFGIAKLVEADDADVPLTRTGQVFGTPMYMPPEQLRGDRDLDGRADVYSLGVTLYELLSGRRPFEEATFPALIIKINGEPPTPLETHRPELPQMLLTLVAATLAKDPDHRPASADAFAESLRAFLRDLPDEVLDADPAESARAYFSFAPTAPVSTGEETGPTDLGMRPPDPPRRTGLWLGGALLAVVAVVGVLAWPGGAPTAPARAVEGETQRDPAPEEERQPAAEEVARADEPAAEDRDEPDPPAQDTAAPVSVRFTNPERAEVRAGDQTCTAPCTLALPPVATTVTARRGDRSGVLRLEPPFPEEVSLTLTRRRPRPGPRRPRVPDLLPQ